MYFKPWGKFFKQALTTFNPIFTQYPSGKEILDINQIQSILVGDPRFDQALENKNTIYQNDTIERFLGAQKAIVFGSAWKEEVDLAKIIATIHPDQKIIIAPHQVEKNHLKSLLSDFGGKFTFLSDFKPNSNVLVVDSVGDLRYIYRYGKLAIVAGGFTGKLHNIIEPLAYGLPVCIGNQHSKFPEAEYAIQCGAVIEGENIQALANNVTMLLNSNDELGRMSADAKRCVNDKSGATLSVLNHPIFDATLRKTTL